MLTTAQRRQAALDALLFAVACSKCGANNVTHRMPCGHNYCLPCAKAVSNELTACIKCRVPCYLNAITEMHFLVGSLCDCSAQTTPRTVGLCVRAWVL